MKVRVHFTKHGKVRFTSHRDVARLFERALRKIRLPVAYSEGFSPRPKIAFGLALSVAHESNAEYLDVSLATAVDLETLPELLTNALPEGIVVVEVGELAPGSISLQQAITSCTWEIEVLGLSEQDVAKTAAELLSADAIPMERERKGKISTADVRPAILQLEVLRPTENGMLLLAELGTDLVSLRPGEFVGLFGDSASEGRVLRLHQWTNTEGLRNTPFDAPVGPAELRAS